MIQLDMLLVLQSKPLTSGIAVARTSLETIHLHHILVELVIVVLKIVVLRGRLWPLSFLLKLLDPL
jgi:hypothetical protein